MFFSYRGSSFIEFLKTDYPDLVPDFSKCDWTGAVLPHGTTVLATVYEGGALMVGDRLATEGSAVGTRDIEKVFKIDNSCCMAIAGAAGPAIEMMRMFRLELEHFQKLEGHDLSYEGKANRLSFLIRQNMPAAMQGLVVMPLFAGFDHDGERGRIYKFDVTGGRYAEADYYATGSGGRDARASLKKSWRRTGFGRGQAIETAVEALMDAADEDRATAAFDIEREIYPTCKTMTKEGVLEVTSEELLGARESVIARRKVS